MASESSSAADGSSSAQPVASTPAPAEPISAPPTTFARVPWPVRPSPGINYNFVVGMYLAGSAIALLFYALEKQMLAPLLEDAEGGDAPTASNASGAEEGGGADESPWKEFAKGMEGMHLIFAPFLPCLLWSLIVRYYWVKEAVSREKKDKKDK